MKYLTTQQLKSMFISGAEEVEKQYKYIDQLNVFPIPDGDTGTNLKITLNGACKSIATLTQENISVLTKSFANGLLMNARGNSGVIFSQIFYGLANSFSSLEDKVEISDFVSGFASASTYAYKSVSNPVEGTILTVIRLVSKKLDEAKTKEVLATAKEYVSQIFGKSHEEAENLAKEYAEKLGIKLGDFMMPIRMAVTGSRVSPPLIGSIWILGKEKALSRIEKTLAAF